MPHFTGNIFRVLGKVAHHLVHSVYSDRGEMVIESAQVTAGIREKTGIHMPGNNFPFLL